MKTCLSGLCAAVFFASVSSASAALVSPVSATTTMGSASGTDLINTVNGVGLLSLSLTATHAATDQSNSWVSGGGSPIGDITFDLGGVFAIQGVSFWNQNGGGPSFTGAEGIQDVVISSSLDNVNYTLVVGAPTAFARDTNAVGTVQQFSFVPISANYVRFSVTSNFGDPVQTAFAEVQFDAAPASVPDSGSTLTLLGSLLLGFAAVKHRKWLS
jgi:hypothetical protein